MRPGRWALTFCFLLMLAAYVRPASAATQDRVSFLNKIVVEPGETVHDVVCFLCSVDNRGEINGDVVSFLGGVRSNGPMHKDVVSFLGSVSLGDGATVEGDLVVFGGNLHRTDTALIGKDQVVFPAAIFLVPLLILFAVFWGITRLIRRPRFPVYMPTRGR